MHDAKLSTIETRIRTLTTTIIGFDDLRNSGENNSAVKNLEYIGYVVAAGFELAELVLKNIKFWCPEAPKKYSPWGWIKADALVIHMSVNFELHDIQLENYSRSKRLEKNINSEFSKG